MLPFSKGCGAGGCRALPETFPSQPRSSNSSWRDWRWGMGLRQPAAEKLISYPHLQALINPRSPDRVPLS